MSKIECGYTEASKKNLREDMTEWLDRHLAGDFPEEVVSLCVNLDEDGGGCDLSGCECFDPENEDWGCEIVYDFGTENDRLLWDEYPDSDDWDDDEWDKVNESEELEKTQDLVAGIVKEYCQTGKYADKLRKLQGVGVGFCDGPLQLVYQQDYK